MIPTALDMVPDLPDRVDEEPHVLIVAKDSRARYVLAGQLLEAGFRITTAGTYGVVEVLLENSGEFDLLVAAQSVSEMTQFGMPQLARSVQPDLPILVLDFEAVGGTGILSAVRGTIDRWPLRDRAPRQLH